MLWEMQKHNKQSAQVTYKQAIYSDRILLAKKKNEFTLQTIPLAKKFQSVQTGKDGAVTLLIIRKTPKNNVHRLTDEKFFSIMSKTVGSQPSE